MRENQTAEIKEEFHVGWFYASRDGSRVLPFVGVGSTDYSDPSLGNWLTLAEASMLHATLSRILKAHSVTKK